MAAIPRMHSMVIRLRIIPWVLNQALPVCTMRFPIIENSRRNTDRSRRTRRSSISWSESTTARNSTTNTTIIPTPQRITVTELAISTGMADCLPAWIRLVSISLTTSATRPSRRPKVCSISRQLPVSQRSNCSTQMGSWSASILPSWHSFTSPQYSPAPSSVISSRNSAPPTTPMGRWRVFPLIRSRRR